jgi:hypothetical protein
LIQGVEGGAAGKHDICGIFRLLHDPVVVHGLEQIPKKGVETLGKGVKDTRPVLFRQLV